MENPTYNKEQFALPVDIENTQHICQYLRGLRKRLRETIVQHTDLIQTSVGIIREMREVSTTLALAQTEPEQPTTKIKRLIMEFESMTAAESDLSSTEAKELRELLANFRLLHESQLLRDSLMCYKRAKGLFEEVETILDRAAQCCPSEGDGNSPETESLTGQNGTSRSLREKIHAFNKASVEGQNTLENFTHCFSSVSGANVAATEGIPEDPEKSDSFITSEYGGDEDSISSR